MSGYGKHFSSMYDGSMYGAGAVVFAVWGYCIGKADGRDFTLEVNPKKLADTLGEKDVQTVVDALAYLCAPDPASRSKEEDGRRLLKIGEYMYKLVNMEHYRAMYSQENRREYQRTYQADRRAKQKAEPDDPKVVAAAQQDTEVRESFERGWAMYGKYGVKSRALKYWQALKPEDRIQIEEAIPQYLRCVAAGRSKSQFEGWINPQHRKFDMDWGAALVALGGSVTEADDYSEWNRAFADITDQIWRLREAKAESSEFSRAFKALRDKYRDIPKRNGTEVVRVAADTAMNNRRPE